MDFTSFWYNLVFALLIIALTYFYTAVTVNPVQMAEDLKRNNGFIPGVKPGKRTAEYIDTIMSRITLPGSFFWHWWLIMPAFAGLLGINSQFAQFLRYLFAHPRGGGARHIATDRESPAYASLRRLP